MGQSATARSFLLRRPLAPTKHLVHFADPRLRRSWLREIQRKRGINRLLSYVQIGTEAERGSFQCRRQRADIQENIDVGGVHFGDLSLEIGLRCSTALALPLYICDVNWFLVKLATATVVMQIEHGRNGVLTIQLQSGIRSQELCGGALGDEDDR